jgi:hypothetical protein
VSLGWRHRVPYLFREDTLDRAQQKYPMNSGNVAHPGIAADQSFICLT